VRLVSSVCEGSGHHNEDGFGFIGAPNNVEAVWVMDGVTVINDRNYLDPAGRMTDAQWIVEKAQSFLHTHAEGNASLKDIYSALVDHLINQFAMASRSIALPDDYDPPATCLILAKRYGANWHVLRCGDSAYLAEGNDGKIHEAMSPSNYTDTYITREAAKRRAAGMLNIDALLQEFRTDLMRSRATRNTSGGYSILEAAEAAKHFVTITNLGQLKKFLICSDGFYRAVDTYQLYPHADFLAACTAVVPVLRYVREVEAADPLCLKFPRFKHADDATAVYMEHA
jgi:serine/threonine protein phosphatase PrpC